MYMCKMTMNMTAAVAQFNIIQTRAMAEDTTAALRIALSSSVGEPNNR